MKKLGIIVSLIITVIATAIYHLGVKCLGVADVPTSVLIVRGISDFFFAGMVMYTCTSIYWVVMKKSMRLYNIIDSATNLGLLCMVFIIEEIIEKTLTSQSEMKIMVLIIIAIIIELNEIGLNRMKEKALKEVIGTEMENIKDINEKI